MEHDVHQLVDFDSNTFDVLFDDCANHTVSPMESDFLNPQESTKVNLQGLALHQLRE